MVVTRVWEGSGCGGGGGGGEDDDVDDVDGGSGDNDDGACKYAMKNNCKWDEY